MHSGILELNGLSIDILDKLSYKLQLGINLKRIFIILIKKHY